MSQNFWSGQYLDGDRSRRNVLLATPGEDVSFEVTLTWRDCNGEMIVEHLPAGWMVAPQRQTVNRAAMNLFQNWNYDCRAAE